MGYLFELAAELGKNKTGVADLVSAFDGVTWTLSDGTNIECWFKPNPSNLWSGPDGNFWCRITPIGVSVTGGHRTITNEEMLIELAQRMYKTLRSCSGFRFALVGWEVAESVDINELLSNSSVSDLPAGLVVDRDLWMQMGSPPQLMPFGLETFLKPLQEADYRALVKLFND